MINGKYYIKFPNRCLTCDEVYRFFVRIYPNRTIYKNICYSNKVLKLIKEIHRHKVSLNRIISIEYLIISKYFEIHCRCRHYGNTRFILIRL